MDVKSEINKNQFTFAFGQNSTKYYFLKYNNSGELASRITTNSYGAEDAANATLSGNGRMASCHGHVGRQRDDRVL